MDGARNLRAFSGTLAGAPVALTGPAGTEGWVVFNDDAAQVYDFDVLGQTIKINPGEVLALPIGSSTATIDGTGAYRAIALDDADAIAGFGRQVAGNGTAAILDNAVTAAKLAAAVAGAGLTGGGGSALAVQVDNATVEINADTVRVKDGGIGAAKLDGVAALGTLGARVAIAEVASVADGATGDVGSFVVPPKAFVGRMMAVKNGGAGAAGDAIELRTAAAGAGNVIASITLDGMTAGQVAIGLGDATHGQLAAGATVYLRRVEGAGDGGAYVELLIVPVD